MPLGCSRPSLPALQSALSLDSLPARLSRLSLLSLLHSTLSPSTLSLDSRPRLSLAVGESYQLLFEYMYKIHIGSLYKSHVGSYGIVPG
eukprot:COSAG02_NODE_2781_length_8038_cov_3.889533_4_plen_89_part_00